MNELARNPAAAAPHRPIAFAPARVARTIDPDGTIRLACSGPTWRLRSKPRAAVSRGSRGAAGARFPAGAHGRWLAQADLRGGAANGRRARGRFARARPFGRAPGDDPVRQRDRPRAADARRLYGRRSGRADLGCVLAAKPGLRQAQAHRRTARARPDLRRRHRAVRQSARGDRHGERRDRREPRRRKPRRDAVRRSRAHAGRRRGRAGSGRQRARTRSRNSCSPPARPACPRASSTPTAC